MIRRAGVVAVLGLVLGGMLIVAGCSSSQSPQIAGRSQGTYTIRRGDTLHHIAQRYGVSVSSLMSANGITSTRDLRVGQVLTIPGYTSYGALNTYNYGADYSSEHPTRIFAWPVDHGEISSGFGIRNGTMWAWTNARWVTFFYSPVGDAESVKRFLGPDLARTVHCDGTSITSFLERTGGKRPGCWAHGRRRLVEAARSGDRVALEGVRIIAKLFAVERASTTAGDNAEDRRARRQEQSRPILDELRRWMDKQAAVTPPKTPLGQGLRYLDRQWKRLLLFLDDGNIEATNNRRERELRRLVLGRRNWLFTWLDEGGQRTADILSIVATCIAHDVNPRAYLHKVVHGIVHGWPQAKLRDLLPDRMLEAHPELYVGNPDALPLPSTPRRLSA